MESKENSNSSWLDRWRGLGWKYQALAISLILVGIIISITAGVLSSGGNQGMYTGILQGHYFFARKLANSVGLRMPLKTGPGPQNLWFGLDI